MGILGVLVSGGEKTVSKSEFQNYPLQSVIMFHFMLVKPLLLVELNLKIDY